jgi:hypothetical protein
MNTHIGDHSAGRRRFLARRGKGERNVVRLNQVRVQIDAPMAGRLYNGRAIKFMSAQLITPLLLIFSS